jgi:hypothetical protein
MAGTNRNPGKSGSTNQNIQSKASFGNKSLSSFAKTNSDEQTSTKIPAKEIDV